MPWGRAQGLPRRRRGRRLGCDRFGEASPLTRGRYCGTSFRMTLVGAVLLLVIASVCGSLGSRIAGYSHIGCLSSIVLGFLGAWVGTWFAGQMHLPPLYVLSIRGESFPVVWSIIGAAMFAAVMSSLMGRSRDGF